MLSPSPNTSNKRAKGRNTHDLPHLHPPQTAWCNTNLILTLSLFSFACFNFLTTSPCSLINNSNFSLFDMIPDSKTHPQTYNVGFFFFRFVHCTCPSDYVYWHMPLLLHCCSRHGYGNDGASMAMKWWILCCSCTNVAQSGGIQRGNKKCGEWCGLAESESEIDGDIEWCVTWRWRFVGGARNSIKRFCCIIKDYIISLYIFSLLYNFLAFFKNNQPDVQMYRRLNICIMKNELPNPIVCSIGVCRSLRQGKKRIDNDASVLLQKWRHRYFWSIWCQTSQLCF